MLETSVVVLPSHSDDELLCPQCTSFPNERVVSAASCGQAQFLVTDHSRVWSARAQHRECVASLQALQVAASPSLVLFLLETGELVVPTGAQISPSTQTVQRRHRFKHISLKSRIGGGLTNTGSVVLWNPQDSDFSAELSIDGAEQVAVSDQFACIRTRGGFLYVTRSSWEANDKIGQVIGLEHQVVTDVSCGESFAAVLTERGAVYAFDQSLDVVKLPVGARTVIVSIQASHQSVWGLSSVGTLFHWTGDQLSTWVGKEYRLTVDLLRLLPNALYTRGSPKGSIGSLQAKYSAYARSPTTACLSDGMHLSRTAVDESVYSACYTADTYAKLVQYRLQAAQEQVLLKAFRPVAMRTLGDGFAKVQEKVKMLRALRRSMLPFALTRILSNSEMTRCRASFQALASEKWEGEIGSASVVTAEHSECQLDSHLASSGAGKLDSTTGDHVVDASFLSSQPPAQTKKPSNPLRLSVVFKKPTGSSRASTKRSAQASAKQGSRNRQQPTSQSGGCKHLHFKECRDKVLCQCVRRLLPQRVKRGHIGVIELTFGLEALLKFKAMRESRLRAISLAQLRTHQLSRK